jgi:glycosyltransferase involved in cell wall biosynthesis
VKFLGFVPSEHMRGLYEGALGVVMPTYFGPTNLPPLEAWALDKPLIYSAHLAEPVGDAAWLVNADRAQDLVEALRACARPEVRERLVASGRQQLARAAEQRAAAEATLLQRLDEFAARRACWAPEGTA